MVNFEIAEKFPERKFGHSPEFEKVVALLSDLQPETIYKAGFEVEREATRLAGRLKRAMNKLKIKGKISQAKEGDKHYVYIRKNNVQAQEVSV